MGKSLTSSLTPQKLRFILISGPALLLAIAIAIFIFSRGVLIGYANDVQQITATADSSSANLATLEILKKKLSDNQLSVERTKNLVAESKLYGYQDQIIKDLSVYAAKAGVTIEGFQFTDGASTTGTTSATPPPATPDTAGATSTSPTPSAGGGLKTVGVSLTLKSPQNYNNIMKFIYSIEQNLTRMQLGGIALTLDEETGGIALSTLAIEVYTR